MNKPTRVLVAYATEHGSTRGIADFIGARLRADGFVVDIRPVSESSDPRTYGTVVLGSAVHNMALLPAVDEYVRRYRDALARTDVWIFGVGLSPALRGPLGRYLKRVVPKKIAALTDGVHARDYEAFAGVFDRAGTRWLTRALYFAIGGGRYGDLRQWPEISNWTSIISADLRTRTEGPRRRGLMAAVTELRDA